MTDIVIVAAVRTAVGKFGGTLAKTPAAELGAVVIKELLARTYEQMGFMSEAATWRNSSSGGRLSGSPRPLKPVVSSTLAVDTGLPASRKLW